MKPIEKSANHENPVVFSSACATMKFTIVPEAPTMPNFTNWRTPRRRPRARIMLGAAASRNPIPVREEYGEEAEQGKRESEDDVIDPRALAPAGENREH